MKTKPLALLVAALLVLGGLWLWHTRTHRGSIIDIGLRAPDQKANSGPMPNRFAPPDPNRKFRELTPEQRVQQARKGPIGG